MRVTGQRLIESTEDLAEGAAWLAAAEPRFAAALELSGPLRLRRRPAGFAALFDAIVSQQVSVASADAIWGRLEGAGIVCADSVRAADDAALRACGLSRQKMRYARALAGSGIDFDALASRPDAEVIKVLTAVTGIGVWTAEIYAMFALGRRDVFASGDLALQEAAKILFEMKERPKDKALRRMAEAWSPWRTVAACLLWQYYRAVKDREGIRA